MYIPYALTTLHFKSRRNLKKGNGSMNNTFLVFYFWLREKQKSRYPLQAPPPKKKLKKVYMIKMYLFELLLFMFLKKYST